MTVHQVLSHRHAYGIADRATHLARTFVAAVGEWRRRSRSRRALLTLDDRELWDLRLSRSDAEHEAYKPFWRE